MIKFRSRARTASLAALALAAGALVAVVSPATVATAVQSPTACGTTSSLVNGGFEQPVIGSNYVQINQSTVPGWDTSASDGLIELWKSGFNGIASSSGNQFAELNATQPSTLSQTLTTVPGETLEWSLDHRGRGGGNNSSTIPDVMQVVIGPLGGTLVGQGDISDTVAAWGHYTGVYVVPAGQTQTVLGFQAVSSAGGNPSIGNFLDNVSFGTGPCVIATKTVTDLNGNSPAHPGDVLQYTISAANQGGNPATSSVLSDVLPAGITIVPGSLSITNSGVRKSVTLASGDDAAEYDSASRTLTARLGSSANATTAGSVLAQDSSSVSFRATIDSSAALSTITNNATVNYFDPLIGAGPTAARAATSNDVSTPVSAMVDLGVTSSFTATPVAGLASSIVSTVTNNGPDAEPDATVTGTIPSSYDSPTVTLGTSTPCIVSGLTYSCDLGVLAVGASRTITLNGSIASDVPSGTTLASTATTHSALYDGTSSNDSATASTPVTTLADLSITKSIVGSAAPIAGSTIDYTITVSNAGPSDAAAVTITDPLSSNLSYVSSSFSQGSGTCVAAGGTVSCSIPAIANGGSAVVHLTLKLASNAGVISVSNSATVSAASADPVLSNNTSSVSRTSTTQADVALGMTVSSPTVLAGAPITYTLSAANSGPSDADNVVVTDVIPTGLTNVTASAPGGTCAVASGIVTCTFSSLVAGAAAQSITIHATVDPSATVGTIDNAASASTATPDSNPSNNSADAPTAVQLSADLVTSLTSATSSVVAGSPIDYTITVTNAGPTRADVVHVTDPLPAGVVNPTVSSPDGICSITLGTITCDLTTLANGNAWTITVGGTVSTTFTGAGLSNTATTSSTSPDPDGTNNSSTVVLANDARLVTTKTVSNLSGTSPAHVGDELQYTVTTQNVGGNPATSALATDVLPAGLTLVNGSITLANGGSASARTEATGDDSVDYSSATRTLTARLGATATATVAGSIPAQGTSVLSFEATIDTAAAASTLSNTATVAYVDSVGDPGNQDRTSTSNTTTTAVAGAVDLQVDGGVASSAVAGTPTTLSLVVSNNGPDAEPAAVITGSIPVGLSSADVQLSDGTSCVVTGSTFTCPSIALASGASVTVTASGEIASSLAAGTILTLGTTATSSLFDQVGANNTSSVSSSVTTSADLSISKVYSDPTPPVAGGIADYTVTVSNAGPSDARSVHVVDALPGSLTLISATVSAGTGTCAWTANSLDCTFPTVANGTTAVVDLSTAIASNLGTAGVSNTATVSSTTPDPIAGNNTSTAGSPSTTDADIAVDMSVDSATVHPGDTVTFTATVSNFGPSDADNVIVTDQLPAGLTNVSVTSPDGTCSVSGGAATCTFAGIVANGASPVITVTGTIPAAAPAGAIDNLATATSGTPDGSAANNSASASTTVVLASDLGVTLTPDSAFFTAGSPIGYTIVVTNNGPTRADGVHLADVLPAAMQDVVVDTLAAGTCAVISGSLGCDLPTLALNHTWTVHVSGIVAPAFAGTQVLDSVTVSSATSDPVTANNTASDPTPAGRSMDLATTISSSTTHPVIGSPFTVTIHVTNNGPSTEASVVTIAVPTGRVTLASGATTVGTFDPATLQWQLPTLAVGDGATLTLHLDPRTTGVAPISASVQAATVADPAPANNSATVVLTIARSTTSSSRLAFTGVTPDGAVTLALFLFCLGMALFVVDGWRRRRDGRLN